MIFDLSSKITLERIPIRYYRTADPVEAIRQTRFENSGQKFMKPKQKARL